MRKHRYLKVIAYHLLILEIDEKKGNGYKNSPLDYEEKELHIKCP